jgi:hypothetical protein
LLRRESVSVTRNDFDMLEVEMQNLAKRELTSVCTSS